MPNHNGAIEESRPTTPPPPLPGRAGKARRHGYTPDVSPKLPSPMSLYQLGIGLPLRRQMSSPLARSPVTKRVAEDDVTKSKDEVTEAVTGDNVESEGTSGSGSEEGGIQDSRDVLVERLNDLASRLVGGAHFEGQTINELHARVDEMERVLSSKQRALDRRKSQRRFDSYSSSRTHDDPFRATGPITPGWLMSQLSDLSQHSVGNFEMGDAEPIAPAMVTGQELGPKPPSAQAAQAIQPARALAVMAEAETLYADLSAVVSRLQARREESEHIQDILLRRAEAAAQRVIRMEERLEQAEDEVQKNESELSHLRLELRAIEARCLEYVPPETDQELLESIENWKRDWARLQRQMTERHMHHEGHSFHGDTTITSMDSVAH